MLLHHYIPTTSKYKFIFELSVQIKKTLGIHIIYIPIYFFSFLKLLILMKFLL